jgi:hypothetical protein
MFRRTFAFLAVIIATLSVVAPSHQAGAVGYWNLPGNVCQLSGYGWGAGYHAKFVLGPIHCHGCCAHNEVRLPYAPQPPYSCYCQSGCGYGFGQPSVLSPSVAPAAAPATEYEVSVPVPVEVEQNELPALEPDDVEMEPGASPAEDSSATPPPPPASQPERSARPLFGPPVER